MKLEELFEAEKEKPGTYAAAHFDSDSKKVIADFIKDNKIPNPTKTEKLHCTVIYSRAHVPNFKAAGKYQSPMVCKPKGFAVWDTQPDEDGNKARCLVLELSCPEFKARHRELMKEYPEATYDYPEFKVHVTLSYNLGDMDEKDLPEIKQELRLVEEYTTPIDNNWAKGNSAKTKS